MDIQVSSNFERLYFELAARDGAAVAQAFARFRETGALPASPALWQEARGLFAAHRVDDDATRASIRDTWHATGELLDPHSAVAVAAARAARRDPQLPMVALASAHPAKFADAVESAVGFRPAAPPRLAALTSLRERITVLPNDLVATQRFVRERARRTQEMASP
jgi:threonine synthase